MTVTTAVAHAEPRTWPSPTTRLGQRQVLRVDGLVLHRRLGARKKALFADLPPVVVELGAGAGASMRYLAPGSRPRRHRTEPARTRRTPAQCRALRDRPRDSRGTRPSRPVSPRASVDAVICTLVLCTVDDQAAALAEVRRILRPGGRFVFIEHVRSGPGPTPSAAAAAPSPLALRLRRLLPRPRHRGHHRGCRLRGRARSSHCRLGGVFVPVWPQISGVAVA